MRRFSSLVGVAVLWAACAVVQAQNVSVFGGYSYVNQDFPLTSPSGGFSGWNATATF